MASTDPAPEPAAESRSCPWCSARVGATDTQCPSCGAALVESASVSDVAIPGVTVVDPEVQLAEHRAAKQLSRAKANATAGGVAAFGLTGLLVHKAFESARGSGDDEAEAFEPVGERPAPTGILPAAYASAPGILPATYEPAPGSTPEPAAPESSDPPPLADTSTDANMDVAPAGPPAQDPWRDLPPSIEGQIEGTQWDPWLGVPAPDPANPPVPNQLTGQVTPSDPWAVEGGPWSEPASNDDAGEEDQ